MSRDHSQPPSRRSSRRIHTLESISVNYEGRTEELAARLPDVSPGGMFINTHKRFPEGAILNLRFRLAISGMEIATRCEVRYCLPGVGVGVQFVGISAEAIRSIEKEMALCEPVPKRTRAKAKKVLSPTS